MNRGVYSAATGMIAAQDLLDIVSNNLANASTNGFKQDGIAFTSALESQLVSGGKSIGSLGSGVSLQNEYTDFTEGSITTTGNPLDVAIRTNNGLFAVQLSPNNVAYTRDGGFEVNQDRVLVTKEGFPVLSQELTPIIVPKGVTTIGEDGAVSSNNTVVGRIGVFDGEFTKLGNNLFSAASATTQLRPRLAPQSIESSNVNPIEAMIQMITLNRTFELAQKSATSHDDLTQRLIQSLSQ